MDPITDVTVFPEANVYFDGKCVSHTIETRNGVRKSVGVIFPSSLNFATAAPERIDIVSGRCRVKTAESGDWSEYAAGQAFSVAGDSSFDIEVSQTLHYVCHFG